MRDLPDVVGHGQFTVVGARGSTPADRARGVRDDKDKGEQGDMGQKQAESSHSV
jgi:hypothetical protein